MRVIKLLIHKEFITNLLTFFLFSIVITLLSNRMPDGLYSSRNWILRQREWEKKGEIYQQLLKVKVWKKFLPELSDFAKGVFPKKTIKEFSKDYLERFLFESRKSEVTHWCIIFSCFLFYLWNDFNSASLILAIAAVLNLPYIIIQRYNRPRIMEVVESIDSHGRKLLV